MATSTALTDFQRLAQQVQNLIDYLTSHMISCPAIDMLNGASPSSLTPDQLSSLNAELMVCLLGNVGHGGVYCGIDDPPTFDPGSSCAKYYNTSNGKEWNWNDSTNTWDLVLS